MGLLESYDRQVKGLKKEILRMCWLMRGGVSYEELMQMGATEREIIAEIAKENAETTKKTLLPYF
jgi:hypothetical protein